MWGIYREWHQYETLLRLYCWGRALYRSDLKLTSHLLRDYVTSILTKQKSKFTKQKPKFTKHKSNFTKHKSKFTKTLVKICKNISQNWRNIRQILQNIRQNLAVCDIYQWYTYIIMPISFLCTKGGINILSTSLGSSI